MMLFGGSMFTKERERGLNDVIRDLQSELRRTQARLAAMSIAKERAEANVARMRRNASKPPVIPSGDRDEGYTCPVRGCHAVVYESDRFCHECGSELDWRTSAGVDASLHDGRRDYLYGQALAAGDAQCS